MTTTHPNYFNEASSLLASKLPDCPPELIRYYTLLLLVKSEDVTLEDVHHAWAAWRVDSDRPDHPMIVPMAQVPEDIQAYDEPYRAVIAETARELRDARDAA